MGRLNLFKKDKEEPKTEEEILAAPKPRDSINEPDKIQQPEVREVIREVTVDLALLNEKLNIILNRQEELIAALTQPIPTKNA